MSAVTASLCSTLMFVLFVSADQKNITAESGQDVTLTCRAPNNNIIVAEWSRADLGDKHVFLYRDEQFDPEGQHPSFKNRVDLQDRQMKDGDVSLILKNVTTADNGAYECRVLMGEIHLLKLINSTYLHVPPPGQTGGPVGLIVGLIIFLLLVTAFGAVVGFFKCRKKKLNPADPHVAERLQPECESDEQTQR
ncbi:unnamed protein product [Oreochromis niloticus]|nr:unnamed protein product [Mustela putorius furo]